MILPILQLAKVTVPGEEHGAHCFRDHHGHILVDASILWACLPAGPTVERGSCSP